MQNKLFDLSGRTALVTGGSKGLGAAMARAFAAAGADVAICSRHEDELKTAAASIAAGLDVRVEWIARQCLVATVAECRETVVGARAMAMNGLIPYGAAYWRSRKVLRTRRPTTGCA